MVNPLSWLIIRSTMIASAISSTRVLFIRSKSHNMNFFQSRIDPAARRAFANPVPHPIEYEFESDLVEF
jgi:hypothetical protein